MPLALATDRLDLRLFEAADAGWYRLLVAERGGQVPSPPAARDKVIELRRRAEDSGIGLLVVRRRDEGDVIGYCGLVVGRSTLAEPEIAYELFARAHRRGYATEAAAAVLDAAVAIGRRRLWSTVRAGNVASLRVLAKLGFQRRHSTWDERGEVVWNVRDL